MYNFYRRFKKNTPLRRFAGPGLVRLTKSAEQQYIALRRQFTRVEHNSRFRAICHVGVQKTGTVWFREMFSDLRMYRYSGLPFVDCAGRQAGISVERGIYAPIRTVTDEVLAQLASPDVATVGVVRNPVALVLSWINSTQHYHITGKDDLGMGRRREALEASDLSGKIDFALDYFAQTERFQKIEQLLETQSGSGAVLVVRYEDCLLEPDQSFARIFAFCDIAMPDDVRAAFIADHDFAAYSGRSITDQAPAGSSLQGRSQERVRELPGDLQERILAAALPRLRDLYACRD